MCGKVCRTKMVWFGRTKISREDLLNRPVCLHVSHKEAALFLLLLWGLLGQFVTSNVLLAHSQYCIANPHAVCGIRPTSSDCRKPRSVEATGCVFIWSLCVRLQWGNSGYSGCISTTRQALKLLTRARMWAHKHTVAVRMSKCVLNLNVLIFVNSVVVVVVVVNCFLLQLIWDNGSDTNVSTEWNKNSAHPNAFVGVLYFQGFESKWHNESALSVKRCLSYFVGTRQGFLV